MHRQPARVLEAADVSKLLREVNLQRHHIRNTAIILLSFKAGLRACEIAGLDWSMVLNSRHQISSQIRIASYISKSGRGRCIPLHVALRSSLKRLYKASGCPIVGPVIMSERGGPMTARSIVNWFGALYRELGLVGCSSHSGRRTFITRSARILAQTGGSLRDIQELAGHRSLTTTERYIAGDRDAQRKLISLI